MSILHSFDYDDDDDDTNESFDDEESNDSFGVLPDTGVILKDYLAQLEVSLIEQALERTDTVVARAAELLGMRRTTLVEKMRKYGLSK